MKSPEAIGIFAALSQDTRLRIYRLLIRYGASGLPAGAIGRRLRLHAATLSFHLGALKRAGLVACRRQSQSLIYAANLATMARLVAFLTENCCRDDSAAARDCALPSPCSEEHADVEPNRV